MNGMKENWGIILLAAGTSGRLGRPKQLLMYNGKTLLQGAIETARASGANYVVLVLGARQAELEQSFDHHEIVLINNAEWQQGMSSSIRTGLNEILRIDPEVNAVVFMACDQPLVNEGLINSLLNKYDETGMPIIASGYGNSVGIPALFDRKMFGHLLALQGEGGAKKIIMENRMQLSVVDFKDGKVDIDTEADYLNLLSGNR